MINEKSKTQKVVICGMLVAVGILMPQIFHIFGTEAGSALLPMHLCIFIAGFIGGPVFGGIVGAITPVISFFLTAMPPMPKVIFMVFELAAYGIAAGIFYNKLKWNVYISLILSQIVGRLTYALVLFVGGQMLSLNIPGAVTVISSTFSGIPGIILQIIVVPLVVMALKRIDKNERTGKSKTTA